MTRTCVHCGEPIRYQIGSAKYRHLRDGRDGPTRCRDMASHAEAPTDDLVEDTLVALDGGQESLDLGADHA